MDSRPLPLPEPYDKHAPHPSRNERHRDKWTWSAWRDWLLAVAGRKWIKSSIRKVLQLRDSDSSNTHIDFKDNCEAVENSRLDLRPLSFCFGAMVRGADS